MRRLEWWRPARWWGRVKCLWKGHGPDIFIVILGPPVRQVVRCDRCGAKLMEVEQ